MLRAGASEPCGKPKSAGYGGKGKDGPSLVVARRSGQSGTAARPSTARLRQKREFAVIAFGFRKVFSSSLNGLCTEKTAMG